MFLPQFSVLTSHKRLMVSKRRESAATCTGSRPLASAAVKRSGPPAMATSAMGEQGNKTQENKHHDVFCFAQVTKVSLAKLFVLKQSN